MDLVAVSAGCDNAGGSSGNLANPGNKITAGHDLSINSARTSNAPGA